MKQLKPLLRASDLGLCTNSRVVRHLFCGRVLRRGRDQIQRYLASCGGRRREQLETFLNPGKRIFESKRGAERAMVSMEDITEAETLNFIQGSGMARKSNEQQNFEYGDKPRAQRAEKWNGFKLISVLSGVGGDLYDVLRLADLGVKVVERDGQNALELL